MTTKTVLRDVPWLDTKVLAAGLLQIGAVEVRPQEPFTWTSGWKAPIYCDNRLVLGSPFLRKWVAQAMAAVVEHDMPEIDLIAGTATAGIPHAAWVADLLNLPMVYVRGSVKGHGKKRRIEGNFNSGLRTLVVEDTLSTGNSAFEAVEALREEGLLPVAVCVIFSYDFSVASERANKANLPVYRLLDYNTLIRYAIQSGAVSDEYQETLLQWRSHPERWGQMDGFLD